MIRKPESRKGVLLKTNLEIHFFKNTNNVSIHIDFFCLCTVLFCFI